MLASLLAWLAFWALSWVWEEICSSEAVSSSMELACSDAPWDSAMLESASCFAPEETCSEAAKMPPSTSLRFSVILWQDEAKFPISSFASMSIPTVRFPSAMPSAAKAIFFSEPLMRREMYSAIRMARTRPMTSAMPTVMIAELARLLFSFD